MFEHLRFTGLPNPNLKISNTFKLIEYILIQYTPLHLYPSWICVLSFCSRRFLAAQQVPLPGLCLEQVVASSLAEVKRAVPLCLHLKKKLLRCKETAKPSQVICVSVICIHKNYMRSFCDEIFRKCYKTIAEQR